jgi:hypothetical protein
MKLGWIDFSKEERNKVMNVLELLSEDGTLDELGIAPVRDGFASLFFPGTSTIQTRAKYFLIVPYALEDLSRSGLANSRVFLERFDVIERKCGEILTLSGADGVIGSRTIKSGSWVKRTPADIYWAGIRHYGIFTGGKMSLGEYTQAVCALNNQKATLKRLGSRKDDAEDYDQDDKDAGGMFRSTFWNIPVYNSDWMEHLTIELTPAEASFLKRQIVETQPESMMANILRSGKRGLLELDGFEDLATGAITSFPEQIQKDYQLALSFSEFILGARIRYNTILSKGKNSAANEAWSAFLKDIDATSSIDIDAIFTRLRIVNPMLRQFLLDIRAAMRVRDFDALDERIYKRECQLKGASRAKLSRAGEFSTEAWIGGGRLDYRFGNAAVIMRDIFEGEEGTAC